MVRIHIPVFLTFVPVFVYEHVLTSIVMEKGYRFVPFTWSTGATYLPTCLTPHTCVPL